MHAHTTTVPELARDTLERLSSDDLASVREAEFLHAALQAQRLRAQRSNGHPPGVCANCGEPCAPTTSYCDDECRHDHQARQRQLARVGRTFS
jgi:hypothetical protein